jgi:hypothetical protein
MKQLCIHACLSASCALLFLIVGFSIACGWRDRPILRPFLPACDVLFRNGSRLLVAMICAVMETWERPAQITLIKWFACWFCWCDFLFPAGPQNGQQQKRGRYSIPTLQSSFSLCSIGRPLFAVPLVQPRQFGISSVWLYKFVIELKRMGHQLFAVLILALCIVVSFTSAGEFYWL